MTYIDYIVNAVPFLILIVSVAAGRIRGFAEIVLSAAIVIVLMLLARKYAHPAAESLTENYIHTRLTEYLSSVIEKNIRDGAESVFDSFPAYISEIIKSSGITSASIGSSLDPAALSERITPVIESSVVIPSLTAAVFALVFIFARISGRIISILAGSVLKLPVIKQVNGLLGAMLGGVTGIIFAALSVLIMFAAAGFLPETEFARAVNDSAALGMMYDIVSNAVNPG